MEENGWWNGEMRRMEWVDMRNDGNDGFLENFVKKTKTNSKIQERKPNYNILGGDYKEHSDQDLHTNPVFCANPRPGDA